VIGPGDLEDVDRCGRVGARHDLDVRCDLAHGECDVRVDLIGLGGDDERCLLDAGVAVGGRIVECADHDVSTLVVDEAGLGDVVEDQHVGDVGLDGPFDDRRLDRSELGQDQVPRGRLGQHPRRTSSITIRHPRHEDELDEHERQHHEQERRPGEQHDHREDATGSDSNVMSPNPSVVIVVRVQYTLVGHEYVRSSYSMSAWKPVLNTPTIPTNTTPSARNVFWRRRRSARAAACWARS
jgi:hypothetical protein